MIYKYVIDSYAWVEYIIGSEPGNYVNTILYHPHASCFTPSIVIAELSFKFHNERLPNWETIQKFIKTKSQIVPLDYKTADESGYQKFQLRTTITQKKTLEKIGLADAIIYQTALNKEALLITGDPHFENIPRVLYLHDKNSLQIELKQLNAI